MKGNYTYLDQLTDKSRNFKIKAKVIQKGRPTQSPSKKRYQRLVLEDEKGNQMRGALFEKDIESFDEALQRGGEYEISNVVVKEVPEKYRSKPNEYQISFNDRVKIVPLTTDKAQVLPNYHSIFSIPRNANPSDLIDVLGIVIFVDGPRPIQQTETKETHILEILITDHSSERPLQISLWDDLAITSANELKSWAESTLTVGFIAMRISHRKGFSLNSSMSTTIVTNPDTKNAELLKQWAVDNESLLHDRRSKAIDIKTESKERHITSLAEIEAKKACNTWQDETFWIEINIPTAALSDLHPYIGCNKCGRKTEAEKNQTFVCNFCKSSDAIAIQRINFNFYANDNTGSFKFIIFNNDVETLFEMNAEELIALRNDDQSPPAVEKIAELQSKKIYLHIGPASGLSASQILKWTVRSIALE